MARVKIINLNQNQTQPVEAVYCDSFFCRLRGLTFRRRLHPSLGLLLVQKQDSRLEAAIHMLAVWMDLAVVWINSQYEVVDVKLARSWRLAYVSKSPARYVLELHSSRLADFKIGDLVKFEKIPDMD